MKKKVLLIAAALLSMSFALNAQSERKLGFRVQAGANASSITNFASKIDNPNVGFRAGVALDIPVQDVLSIRPTVLFESLGERVDLSVGKATARPMYVTVPVLLNCNMGGGENLNFYVNAGPYVSYGVCGKLKSSGGDVFATESGQYIKADLDLFKKTPGYDKDGNEKEIEPMNRFDVGLNTNIGLEIGKYFFVETGFSYGFMNCANSVKYGAWPKQSSKYTSSHNISYHLSVGVKF